MTMPLFVEFECRKGSRIEGTTERLLIHAHQIQSILEVGKDIFLTTMDESRYLVKGNWQDILDLLTQECDVSRFRNSG